MTLFGTTLRDAPTTRSAGTFGAPEAGALSRREGVRGPGKVRGQIDMLRESALRKFLDILTINPRKDTAILVWLDNRTNNQGEAAGELRRARS